MSTFSDGAWFASGDSTASFYPDERPLVEGAWFASGGSACAWYGALSWVARCGGAFTFDPVGGPAWDGTLRRDPEVLIQTQANDSPSQSTFTDEEEPALGQNVQLDMQDGHGIILGGTVQSYVTRYEGQPDQLAFDTTIADYLFLLNKRRPFGCFTDVSASTVAQALLDGYAPADFSGAGIVPGLPSVTVTFDGSLDFSGCMSVICGRISGHFRVDRDKVLHLFLDDPAPGPQVIDDSNMLLIRDAGLTISRDMSQLRNRVFVRGAAAKLLADSSAGTSQIEIDGLDIFNTESGGEAIIGCDRFTYAGVQKTFIYPPPDASLMTGPTILSQLMIDGTVFRSGPIRTIVRYSSSLVFDGKEGARSVPLSGPTNRVNPTMGSSVDFISGGGFVPANQSVEWIFGFRDSGGALYDVNIGSTGSTSRATMGAYLVTVSLGLSANEVEPAEVVLWRRANIDVDPGPPSTQDGWFYEVESQAYVPGQSVYQFTDGKDDASLGNPAPWDDGLYAFGRYDTIGHQIEVQTLAARNTAYANGASQLKIYREEAYNGGASWTDPEVCMTFDTTEAADTPVFSEDFKGTTAHLYAFDPDPTNQNSHTPPAAKPKVRLVLFGVSGLDEEHFEGDDVNIFMELNDLASQVAMAQVEGGDGLHEYMVADTGLRSDAELQARGQAELTLFKDPIVTVQYSSYDSAHTPGGTVEFNLTRPPLVASLKITEVRIDKVHYEHGHVARYNVTASSVKFTLQDLLRRTILRPY